MSGKTKRHAGSEERAERRVRLRVICLRPPPPERHGAEFGLQDNSTTADWLIHAGAAHPNGDIQFECECRVKPNQRTQAPSFLGSFVHGDASKRFLYLSWRPKSWRPGRPDPPGPAWLRRIKVHLSSITWAQIDQAARIDRVLEAVVQGTGRDGGPSCASVALVGGEWRVRRA